MKRGLGVAALCVGALTASAAYAGDRPATMPSSWAGSYAGLHGGYGWGSSRVGLDALIWGEPTPWFTALDSTDMPGTYRFGADGFLGGLQVGHNFQSGASVFGVEADISYAGISGRFVESSSYTGGSPPTTKPYILNLEQKLDWLATLRVRLGQTYGDSLLFYGTGGLAIGNVRDTIFWEQTGVGGTDYFGSKSKTRAGWTVGAGAEYRLAGNLSAKIEYLYYDFGKTVVTGIDIAQASNPFQVRARFTNRGHIFRLGLNYKFSN